MSLTDLAAISVIAANVLGIAEVLARWIRASRTRARGHEKRAVASG